MRKHLYVKHREQTPEHYTGTPNFIALHVIELHRYCVGHKLKVCGISVSNTSIGTIFLTAVAHFCVSASHFGNCHNISNFVFIIVSVRSVISNL